MVNGLHSTGCNMSHKQKLLLLNRKTFSSLLKSKQCIKAAKANVLRDVLSHQFLGHRIAYQCNKTNKYYTLCGLMWFEIKDLDVYDVVDKTNCSFKEVWEYLKDVS
jgi:hypothetical protein